MDGGQRRREQAGDRRVVEADDTQVSGNLKTSGPRRFDDACCAVIRDGKDRSWWLRKAEQHGGSGNSVLEIGTDIAYIPAGDGDAFGFEGRAISVQPGL